MKCAGGKKSIPINKELYNKTKNTIKRRSRVWPSAYASSHLVRAYKSKGGKYRCAKFGSLDRWFKEKWVNVCKPLGNGKYQTCGRKSSSWKNYPYCRPLRMVNKNTPRTVGELKKSKIKAMCRKKRKNPRKKIFQFGENKNESKDYNMNKEPQTCGFGKCNCGKMGCKSCFGSRRSSRFGLHPQPWDLNSKEELRDRFHQLRADKFRYYENIYKGTHIHIKGTPKTELHIVRDFRMYEPIGESMFGYYDENGEIKAVMAKDVTGFNELPPPPQGELFGFGSRRRSRFGYNLGPTNSNLDTFYKNGKFSLNLTKSSNSCLSSYYGRPVTRFGKQQFIQEAVSKMKRKGTTGSFTRWCKRHGFPKVTTGCINLGKRNKSLKIRRRAVFAQNIRPKSRKYGFGSILELCRRKTLGELYMELKFFENIYVNALKRTPENAEQIEKEKNEAIEPILQVIKEKQKNENVLKKLLRDRETKGSSLSGRRPFKYGEKSKQNQIKELNKIIKYLSK